MDELFGPQFHGGHCRHDARTGCQGNHAHGIPRRAELPLGGGHVGLAGVMEGLTEVRRLALHISEMGEGDLATKASNARWDVLASRSKGALTKAKLIGGTITKVEHAFERVVVDDDAILAA